MINFKEDVLDEVLSGQKTPDRGIPTPLDKLNSYANYVQEGELYCISGRPESGKSSFMDFVYMINIYKRWKSEDPQERGELKIFYFNMKHRPKLKYQKWVCLYLQIEYGILIDVPTLINGVGRLYDLDDDIMEKILLAQEFFLEFERDVLLFYNGRKTPSSIIRIVESKMENWGTPTKTGYNLSREFRGQKTYLFLDNTDKLVSENDGFQMMTSEQLKNKTAVDFKTTLCEKYNITCFVISPSRLSYSRMVKDSEPSYRDLGPFYSSSDIGIVLYNPYVENNNHYLGYPVDDLVIRGKNRFRAATLVKNNGGIANVTFGLIYVGENGFFKESPHPTDVSGFDEIVSKFIRNGG